MSDFTSRPENRSKTSESSENQLKLPSISLPKGGGAIRGIGEKFTMNPVLGTGSFSIPIFTSLGRSGFSPQLALSYNSGSGNGPFGLGWSLSLPSITRKTDKGLPEYNDSDESDVFILSDAEDLVPAMVKQGEDWKLEQFERIIHGSTFHIQRYRPRIEGLFSRIERWKNKGTGETHWRSISRENITTIYGKTENSRIFDPSDKERVFSWLICESYDDKGNAIIYEYQAEDSAGVDITQAHESNRDHSHLASRYLKRIKYGNCTPYQPDKDHPDKDWLFEVVFDYDEGHYEMLPDENGYQFVRATMDRKKEWSVRQDPFSNYRAGFEIRTYRLCYRVMMFHHFKELSVESCLVRSTEFSYSDSLNKGPAFSFITKVTQSGYVLKISNENSDHKYLKKSMPPLEFEYSQANTDYEIRDFDTESLKNLPFGLEDMHYQLVDIDGEGVSGILIEQAGIWFYKRNISPVSKLKDELGNPVKNEYGDFRSKAQFGPIEIIRSMPSLANLSGGRQQLLDLAGDGQLDLAEFNSPTPGFYERTEDQQWKQFTPFSSLPNIDWNNPNLRFLDLTGDGHADIIITEDEVFTWYESLAEAGFSSGERICQALDEEKGSRLVFSDITQSIYLADMSGDGLMDLVRIRNCEVCYWPNLGYGHFGTRITMDNSPLFDIPDQFNQQRIRLADIDGSGTTDIIYLKSDGVHVYFNQSGNSWTELEPKIPFFQVDNLTEITMADLLGNGTACLVWSSLLPGNSRQQMRYIDLMGGQKPYLLVGTRNNLGVETRVRYAPSTKFYLEDKKAGKPWITRIPFPVHVVERVEIYDRISQNRFVTRYAYHHGYFDGIEREFRGFGMVEQWDTEEVSNIPHDETTSEAVNLDEASYVPPILTKTWYHTGTYLEGNLISKQFEGEYYREPGLTEEEHEARLLQDTILPRELNVQEAQEACRALKGSILRQEIYSLDDSPKSKHPYSVSERNFSVKILQPGEQNPHSVFFTHSRETIDYHYERNPADPRISHALTLEVDNFGNVLKYASIGYGRLLPDMTLAPADRDQQTKTLITYTESRFTNSVELDDAYRAPLPCETQTYELTGLKPASGSIHFSYDELLVAGSAAEPINYEVTPSSDLLQKRLIEHVRTLYRPDDLGVAGNNPLALLSLGKIQSLALPGESYKLAFTQGLLTQVFQRKRDDQPPENILPDPASVLGGGGADRGGYLLSQDLKEAGVFSDSDPDDYWWVPSGLVFYSSESTSTPAQELTYARKHFFLPNRYRDPFHTNEVSTEILVAYDAYDLLVQETRDMFDNRFTAGERDAAGNLTKSGNDYRILQPCMLMDPNRNRIEVAFDALGMVVATAVMGKPEDNPQQGDRLDETFQIDLTQEEIDQFFTDPKGPTAAALLNNSTTRVVYDLTRYWRNLDPQNKSPVYAATLVRETHASDPVPDSGLKIQMNFSYFDGFGHEIQKKIQAEPGPVPIRDPATGIIITDVNGQPKMTAEDVSPRWVGNSWTVFNNKGKPVRQYEPFFTDTHGFEFDARIGVSSVICYDPVERVVATLHPNNTWEKVVFGPWRQEVWDVNDTVKVHPLEDGDISRYVSGYFKLVSPGFSNWKTWLEQRGVDPLNPPQDTPELEPEKKAAVRTLVHADTPTVTHFDTLGRTYLTVVHNRFRRSNMLAADPTIEGFHHTRTLFDIEGNQREVVDAKLDPVTQQGRIVMLYDYDMLGNRIHQASMEAGERWTLNDVADKPIRIWNSRVHDSRTAYDPLRRPTESHLKDGEESELLVERIVYGESRSDPEAKNLRGQVYQVFDQAGIVASEEYDFKGNLLRSRRQLSKDYESTLDWSETSAQVVLEDETFISSTTYDAFNRPTQIIAPHSNKDGTKINVIQPVYNEANLLEREDIWLEQNDEPDGLIDTATATHHSVKNIDYNAKGQREFIEYGNGVSTTYEYDALTFRLAHMETLRDTEHLQDIFYTYDPAGNIVNIRDDSQQTIYFNGQVVRPDTEYRYDSLYRLIEASGREHIGQASQPHTTWKDEFRINLAHPNDGQAMRNYFEFYEYDEAGNILLLDHKANNGNWVRSYQYNEESQTETGRENNCLSRTVISPNGQQPIPEQYTHDVHGNMTSMPHLSEMGWNFKDQLQMVDKGEGCKAFYVYDTTGQRVRKVIKQNGTRKKERIYLDGFEVYREFNGSGSIKLERETLHVMDNKQRVAIMETRIQGTDPFPATLIRYQLGNHLNSVSLELDHQARIISYEEYYPYGSTSYQAVRSQTETPKRYRYTGKERDEESGFCYYEMRYYAPWLGRWMSSDPYEIVDGVNTFYYARNNPVVLYDPNGTDSKTPPLVLKKPDKDIGEFKKEELADATMTVFGELTAKLHPKSSEEAKAIASTIFNRLERIKTTREEYKKAKEKLEKAKVKMEGAASKFEELGKNPSKYKKELGKEEYEEELKKAKEAYNEAKKEVGKLGKAATDAASEKIAAESRIKKEKRSNTRITLTDIVEQNKEYEGTKKGKEDFKNFPSMSDPEKERNFKRWEIAKKAVEELAKDPSKADSYQYFVSEKIKERAPSSGTTKIGGNIFW